MRAIVFLLVFLGLAFVGYRYWNPESPAQANEGPEEVSPRIDGGVPEPYEPVRTKVSEGPAPRVKALLSGSFELWRGKPLDREGEGDSPELRYAASVALAAGPRSDRTGLAASSSALLYDAGATVELRAAGFEELGRVGRWEAAAEATGGRNDALLHTRARHAIERLLAASRAAEVSAEDACLWTSAVLDAFTAGGSYLDKAESRDLFAQLYQAQQDALGASLFARNGSWRSRSYKVKPSEVLSKISRKLAKQIGVPLSPGLLMLVNGIRDARRIQVGQVLRVPSDEMRVLIERGSHTLKLFLGPVLLRIYPVGLGAEGQETPVATFKVTKRLKNPAWTNPRTGAFFPPGAPGNALGGYFIGLAEPSGSIKGYGIHGTDDQGSIGRNESMGCIRLRKGDIAELFELIALGVRVRVR